MTQSQNQKYAIRFGLGAIKAVGLNSMKEVSKVRKEEGNFSTIYDFCEKVEPKSINKKSIEALAKSGAFDCISDNRRQLAESFDILSSYATQKNEEANSNQMSLFGGTDQEHVKPKLKQLPNWQKEEKLNKEFEAFGFFLNEHPLDDKLSDLKKRGVIFSDKIERGELEDGFLLKMAGVVSGSKHRSGSRGRFAYITISDPFGIFEAMIFDEELITAARDILVDGSQIVLQCLIRKDDGGIRILVREITKLEDFIKNTTPKDKDFEDIKKRRMPNRNQQQNTNTEEKKFEKPQKIAIKNITLKIENRDAIFNFKSYLSRCQSSEESLSNITLMTNNQKITLPQKYLIDEADLKKISAISGIEILQGE